MKLCIELHPGLAPAAGNIPGLKGFFGFVGGEGG